MMREAFYPLKRKSGFSLAELIVSAAIITFTIIVLVTILRKGNEVTSASRHRERARALIDSSFESSAYHYTNYTNLIGETRTVLIDPRNESDPADNLTGTLRISVEVGSSTAGGGVYSNIEFKRVSMSVSWLEVGGRADTVALEKLITKIPNL